MKNTKDHMDALSKIFDDIHLTHAEYFYLQPHGEWQFQMLEQERCIIYIFLAAQGYICTKDNECTRYETGDIAILPSGTAHHAFVSDPHTMHASDKVEISQYFNGHRSDLTHIGDQSQTSDQLILCVRCHLDITMARPLLQALPTSMRIFNAIGTGAPEWLKIGLDFFTLETSRFRLGRNTLVDRLVGILMVEVVRDYIEQLNDSSNWLSALTHPQLSNALAAIHEHPQHSWTVAELAQICCMSRSKFSEIFSSIINETPLAYLAQHRLRLASRYLRESALHIHQIAERVGYSSETAFSQAFKRQFQFTPSQYRQHHLANQ